MPDEDPSQQPVPTVEDTAQQASPQTTPIDVSTGDPTPEVPVQAGPTENEPAPVVSDTPASDVQDNISPVSALTEESAPVVSVPISTPVSASVPTTSPSDHSSSAYLKSLVPLSLAERNRRRQAHIERLINHAAKKGSISRRGAQLLLEISGATADRYLRELASQGRIVKENNGRYTIYKFVR